jgi:hypothetical protein
MNKEELVTILSRWYEIWNNESDKRSSQARYAKKMYSKLYVKYLSL